MSLTMRGRGSLFTSGARGACRPSNETVRPSQLRRPKVSGAVRGALVALLGVAATSFAAQAKAQPGKPTAAGRDKTEDLTLAVGETKTLSAKDVRNFNDSGQG